MYNQFLVFVYCCVSQGSQIRATSWGIFEPLSAYWLWKQMILSNIFIWDSKTEIFHQKHLLGKVLQLKCAMQSKSHLSFTHQVEKAKAIAFLNRLVARLEDRLLTLVHVKDTNSGDCNNFNGVCPGRWSTSIIKTFLQLLTKTTSQWSLLEKLWKNSW